MQGIVWPGYRLSTDTRNRPAEMAVSSGRTHHYMSLIINARSNNPSAVLEIVMLSVRLFVCPSDTCVLCEEMKKYTDDILMPHERAITLVFWSQ